MTHSSVQTGSPRLERRDGTALWGHDFRTWADGGESLCGPTASAHRRGGDRCDFVQECDARGVIRKEMNVGGEREGWRMVAQPNLHLLRVRTVPEQHRGAGVPQ